MKYKNEKTENVVEYTLDVHTSIETRIVALLKKHDIALDLKQTIESLTLYGMYSLERETEDILEFLQVVQAMNKN